MTERQRQFCDEYLIDLNATRAYKAVYKNVKRDDVAAVNGSKLLRNTKVKSYIQEQLQKISSSKIADATEVMEYLTSVMRGDSESSVLKLDGQGFQSIVSKPPDEKEKLKAAELLGKRYALFTDKVDMDVVVPVFQDEDKLED